MVNMAQRTSAEVQAIFADHEGLVETAFVRCAEPGCRAGRDLNARLTDEALAKQLRADGWYLRKGTGVAGVRCPKHNPKGV